MYRAIANGTTDGILVLGLDGRIKWANPAMCALLHGQRDKILGKMFFSDFVPADRQLPAAELENFNFSKKPAFLEQHQIIEIEPNGGGRVQLMINFSHPENSGFFESVIAICRDVSAQVGFIAELHKTRAKLNFAAQHDPLTGLANRAKLKALLKTKKFTQARSKGQLGVFVIDLDKFKELNDKYGHAAGDAALRHVASVLSQKTRSGCIVSRTGGDEFQVFSPGIVSQEALLTLGKRLVHEIGKIFTWDNQMLQVSATIGASLGRSVSDSGEELVHQADLALYHRKRAGRGEVAVYTPQIREDYLNERNLLAELKSGILRDEFITFLQPQLDLKTNEISGFEALIRWQHPERGLLSPFAFLPMAEANGLILQLDNIAMHHALRAAGDLGKTTLGRLNISINASEQSLAQSNYASLVQWAADAHDVPLDTICIEILETTILSDTKPEIIKSIEKLKALGITVALDDFGTGFAGLSHMSELDVDAIKIDRSLVDRLEHSPRNQKIVRALISLCADLDIKVVVEGAETDAQLLLLNAWHCPLVQGYGIAVPMPANSAIEWVQQRKSSLGQTGTIVTPVQFSQR